MKVPLADSHPGIVFSFLGLVAKVVKKISTWGFHGDLSWSKGKAKINSNEFN